MATTKRKVAHKVTRRAVRKSKPRRKSTLSRLGKAAGFLALPIPDVEMAVAAMANPGSGVKFVLGIVKKAGKRASEVQSVLFDKVKWTATAAKTWLRDHGFTGDKADEGATLWRFRQQAPGKYKEFRTIVPGAHQNPEMRGRYEHPAPMRGWKSPISDWKLGPYDEYSPAHTKAQSLQRQGHYIRQIEAEHGIRATGGNEPWWIHGYSRSEDIPEGAIRIGVRNPGPWPEVYKTRHDAEAAWYDSMPGRNDRAEYVKVKGGYQIVEGRPLGGRGHYGTTVDDMERGDTGFVENPDATYRVRFIRPNQAGELMDLYHLARTALSGGDASNYNRMLWASKEFSKAHPEVSSTAAYKDLDGLRSNWFGARNPTPHSEGSHYAIIDGVRVGLGTDNRIIFSTDYQYLTRLLVKGDHRIVRSGADLFYVGHDVKEYPTYEEENPVGNPQHTITGPHNTVVRIHEQGPRSFLSTFWVNGGETITSQRATHSTLAGAKRWAEKTIQAHVGRGGYSDPTPGEAITAYDEHLATTTDPAFAAASPDEQAAAMTAQDLCEGARENPSIPTPVELQPPFSPARVRDFGLTLVHQLGGEPRNYLHEVGVHGQDPDAVHYLQDAGYHKSHGWLDRARHQWWVYRKEYPLSVAKWAEGNPDMGGVDNPSYHAWAVQEQSPISGWHTVSTWITHEAADKMAKELAGETGVTHRVMHKDSGRGYQIFKGLMFGGVEERNPQATSHDSQHPDLGQAAFDAGKDFRLSGAYSETGVANARVAKYGFSKWYNSFPPGEPKGRKATFLKNWMEGWAAGKRVEKRQGNPGGPLPTRTLLLIDAKFAKSAEHLGRIIGVARREGWTDVEDAARAKARKLRVRPAILEKHAGSVGNPESSASSFYEEFHGRAPGETLEIVTEKREHEWLVQLGVLRQLKVNTVTGLDATIDFSESDAPEFCSNEGGTQLFVEGGDQSLPLDKLGFKDKHNKESVVVGQVREVTYETRKSFDDFKVTQYYHKFADPKEPEGKGGELPTLVYDAVNGLLSLSGGTYSIAAPGVQG